MHKTQSNCKDVNMRKGKIKDDELLFLSEERMNYYVAICFLKAHWLP